jgi:hypothetical protein
MRKKYQTMEVEFEYFQTSDVVMASVPTGGNNDGTIDDIYDLL